MRTSVDLVRSENMFLYQGITLLAIRPYCNGCLGGPTWTWGWRPGWMWLLAFVWLYALILRPLANAAFGAAIEAVDLTILMTLTGVFTGLYMGGHTAKSIVSGLRRHPDD